MPSFSMKKDALFFTNKRFGKRIIMNKKVNFDSPGVVLSGILLGTIGVLSFIVQPGLVQGFVSELNLTEAAANQLAFDEMLAVAIATFITSFTNKFIDWRKLLGLGLLLAVAGNFASAYASDNLSQLSTARFIAGFGEGIVISLSFTIIGLTTRTERNLAAYLVLLLTYGAIGLWIMPSAFENIGLSGIFVFWGGCSFISLITVLYVPSSALTEQHSFENTPSAPLNIKLIALVGILLFNLAIGTAWANLFLIGLETGQGEQEVANALLLCQFVAIFGALIPVFLERQLGLVKPIVLTIVFSTLAIGSLIFRQDYLAYVVAVCIFNAMWNFGLPFILSGVGGLDQKGNMIAFAIALQMVGLGFGPFLAAMILGGDGSFNDIKVLIVSLFIVSAIPLLYALTKKNRHQRGICLANESYSPPRSNNNNRTSNLGFCNSSYANTACGARC